MNIEVYLLKQEPDDIHTFSLLSFIRDRKIRADRVSEPPKEDEYGNEYLDIINVIIDNITDLAPLIIAFLDWKKTNEAHKEVEVEVKLPDGQGTITIKGEEDEVMEKVEALIKKFQKIDEEGE